MTIVYIMKINGNHNGHIYKYYITIHSEVKFKTDITFDYNELEYLNVHVVYNKNHYIQLFDDRHYNNNACI